MEMSWPWRIARRFLVLFVAGGLTALIQFFSSDPTYSTTIYAGFAIAILTAAEKGIRDHSD